MRSIPWLRLVTFLVIAAHMQAGPIMRQVLHAELPLFGMNWQMYSGRGSDICEVAWYESRDGALVPLNRAAILGGVSRGKLPSNLRIQRSPSAIQEEASRICKKKPGTDVRAQARCAIKRGMRWKSAFETDTPMCNPPRKPAPNGGAR